MGVMMGWIQIKMGHPLARNGAACMLKSNGVARLYYVEGV